MAGRLRTAPDPVAGASAVGSSTNVDSLPRGRLAGDEQTTDIPGITSGTGPADVITLDPVAVGDARCLSIHGGVTVRTNISGGISCAIYEDGIQIQRKNIDALEANRDFFIVIEIESQPSAGNHSYVLGVGASGADGNSVAVKANGASGTHGVCWFYVDDCGPAYS